MLQHLLSALVFIPVVGFVVSILVPKKRERVIFTVAIGTVFLELVTFFFLGYRWFATDFSPVLAHVGSLYTTHQYSFALDFYFDKLGVVFLGMTAIMTALVFIFSKYYMHREQGFKRFYSTVLLFFTGLSLIILAGNFEVLVVGWELIGISSVLLIAFYRDRFLPARNALKVFSVYRIADAFLLAATLYAHHIFDKNVNFSEFSELIAHHGNSFVVLGTLLFVAALIKSAQFPFSYWLPRAMEGPTTSSAIFYGALSVHMGLFLMLRTYPLWEGSVWLRIAIAGVGLVTAIVASSIARVQSSIKTQIAYASITQIGIMFIELAAGLHWLVLLHFVSNAALRTYQLLISPSVVSYLVHDQFFYFVPPVQKIKNTFLGKIHGTFYVLGVKEWNMNSAISRFIWMPFKTVGRAFAFLDRGLVQIAALALFLGAGTIATFTTLSAHGITTFSAVAAIVSVIFYIRAYTSKNAAQTCWNLIMLGHLFGALFLAVAASASWKYVALDGAGTIVAYATGLMCLRYLHVHGEQDTLREYHGAIFSFARLGNLFFIVALVFMAFPISPSFLVQDVLLSLIPGSHVSQTVLFCFSYLFAGVSIMRLYVKVFFGPHKTSSHERAYLSS
ncbi:MAG TPA: proton-conducting transporter membrane subunit [Candidatus Saccharimonadales bacterium]|nr:proton-conducting transporter membrane subunit [Candidatus Saccharimonadales bacterium]